MVFGVAYLMNNESLGLVMYVNWVYTLRKTYTTYGEHIYALANKHPIIYMQPNEKLHYMQHIFNRETRDTFEHYPPSKSVHN